MVALEILDKFSQLPQIRCTGLEDCTDRLNFQYTVILTLAFFTTVTLKTYILTPVSCYAPNYPGSETGLEQYINNYCWTEGTFAVPIRNFSIRNLEADPVKHHRHAHIMYYQWVPFMLGIQALLFYLPRFMWTSLSYYRAGTDVSQLVRTANEASDADGKKRRQLVGHIARRLDYMLCLVTKKTAAEDEGGTAPEDEDIRRSQGINPDATNEEESRAAGERGNRNAFRTMVCRTVLCLQNFARCVRSLPRRLTLTLGHYLIVSYLVVKTLYLINAIGQMVLMHKFLEFDPNNWLFGITVLWDLIKGNDWHHTMIFPRVGCCAVPLRTTSTFLDYYFAQCTLTVNMINEKIYVFLWFWVACVAFFTLISFPVWLYSILADRWHAFIKRCLKLSDNQSDIQKDDKDKFVRDFLRIDGIFLLRMISINSGEVICTEIISKLWATYCSRTMCSSL